MLPSAPHSVSSAWRFLQSHVSDKSHFYFLDICFSSYSFFLGVSSFFCFGKYLVHLTNTVWFPPPAFRAYLLLLTFDLGPHFRNDKKVFCHFLQPYRNWVSDSHKERVSVSRAMVGVVVCHFLNHKSCWHSHVMSDYTKFPTFPHGKPLWWQRWGYTKGKELPSVQGVFTACT